MTPHVIQIFLLKLIKCSKKSSLFGFDVFFEVVWKSLNCFKFVSRTLLDSMPRVKLAKVFIAIFVDRAKVFVAIFAFVSVR